MWSLRERRSQKESEKESEGAREGVRRGARRSRRGVRIEKNCEDAPCAEISRVNLLLWICSKCYRMAFTIIVNQLVE